MKHKAPSNRHANIVLATDAPPLDTSKLRYDYSQVSADIRQEVIEAAVDILAHGNRAKQSIVAMGQRLIEVKALLPEGKFTQWISTEFELSDRMAQNFMNVARQYGERPEITSVLNDTVLYLLAAPSTPDEARQQVEAMAKSRGTSPKVREVKAIRGAHIPPPSPPPAHVVYMDPAERLQPSQHSEVAYEVHDLEQPIPTLPDDLVNAGFRLVKVSEKMWAVERDEDPEPFRTNSFYDPGDAIADALQMLSGNREMVGDAWISKTLTEGNPANVAFMSAVNMATEAELRSAQFQTTADDTHADARAVAIGKRLRGMGVVGASAITDPDPRLAQAQHLRHLLNLTREAANREYAQLTGRFTDIPPLERSLETMIAHLDSLIAALSSDGAGGADAG